jgi:SAM-dependent methyltransferase
MSPTGCRGGAARQNSIRHAGASVVQPGDRVHAWLAALDARHLADLTSSEAARAVRALSSCYVERRGRLASGGALDSAGKRAAFALFYAPVHFLTVREIIMALPAEVRAVRKVLDLGCGTGAAGAAWAIASHATRISGIDRHPWAVAEAQWTYRQLALPGRASVGNVARTRLRGEAGLGVLLAYTVNELPDEARSAVLEELLRAARQGTRILIVEPIARRMARWWDEWERQFSAAGGRGDEWRFDIGLPARQHALARAAGLDPRELTARSLWL